MTKQKKKPTRAHKIGYGAAAKNLPNKNPYVPKTAQWEDFNAGYQERVDWCIANGEKHISLEKNNG